MKPTSIAAFLIACHLCGFAFGQSATTGSLPAITADSQLPGTISPESPPRLIDTTTVTPTWQSSPDTATQVAPFGLPLTVIQIGWYLRTEAMLLKLSHSGNQPLVDNFFDRNSGSPGAIIDVGTAVSTNSISSSQFEIVPRATLGYQFDDGAVFEATYFGRNDWSRSASAGTSSSVTFVVTPDLLASDNAAASLSTSLHSFELNVIQPFDANRIGTNRNFEILTGLRYFQLNEQFRLQTDTIANQALYQSNYNVQTANHLYGAQFGVRWSIQMNRWSLSAIGKTGAYYNDASQQQYLAYTSNLTSNPPRNFGSSNACLSLIQELGINTVYQFNDWCSFRAGYNAFVIQGLARACDQLDFSTNATPSFWTHGTAVLHGPSAGLEFRF